MSAPPQPWTCPFCPLLCDSFGVAAAADGTLALAGSDCARAAAALARFSVEPAPAGPLVRGAACDLDAAVDAAAALLAASHQPLFGGLGTDVAGARALHALACRCGAICDAAHGEPLMQGVRALQDRGGYGTTLAEVRNHADLILCFGRLPTALYPEFFGRIGIAQDDDRVLVLDAGPDETHRAAAWLAALVEGRALQGAPAAPAAAAERLLASRYAVLVYENAALGAHAALVIEMLQRVVATLNRRRRAAALALGGGDGAATVNQVFGWLSGLPLRSRPGPYGVQHEPLRYAAAGLCADAAVDLLLWVASFGTETAPPQSALPSIVIGHPAFASQAACVYIPVSTPGIGSDGHLFRTDGVVLMPLHALRAETLPTVADVLQRLHAALPA